MGPIRGRVGGRRLCGARCIWGTGRSRAAVTNAAPSPAGDLFFFFLVAAKHHFPLCFFTKKIHQHQNNKNRRLWGAVAGGVAGRAYEGHSRVLVPASAWCCKSTGCGGCWPGLSFISTRFLMQPVMPEVNLPAVRVCTAGAPPAGNRERSARRAGHRGGN